jgi:Na+-translocating ferredoxin:NAD+ oxidoreductase RnfE subunit
MLLAYDYPLLNVLLSVTWFFLWVLWIITLFHVVADIFRSHELSGLAKTLWMILVIFLPYIGVFAYVIARGDAMAQHAIDAQEARDAAAQEYIRQAAGTSNVADQLGRLGQLRAEGTIDDADYEAAKAKILA